MTVTQSDIEKDSSSAISTAHLVYLLQALVFFSLFTFIIGIIIAYAKQGKVTEPWIASHYRWQIATFWYALLFGLTGFLLILFTLNHFISQAIMACYLVLLVVILWIIYRIVKGWLRLSKHREVR